MNYDPIKVVSETFTHLGQKPAGHVKVALTMFLLLQGMVFGLMCLGSFGLVGGMAATKGDAGAQLGLMLLFYVAIFGMFAMMMPPLMLYYYGYQKATLDEVDGKGDVTVGAVFAHATGALLPLLALMAIQCGVGIAGMLLCYVGVFVTSVPLRFAALLHADRGVGVMEAVGLAWEGFWAQPGAHLKSMLVVMVLAMLLSYIPFIGPMLSWPVLAVYEARSYRAIHGASVAAE